MGLPSGERGVLLFSAEAGLSAVGNVALLSAAGIITKRREESLGGGHSIINSVKIRVTKSRSNARRFGHPYLLYSLAFRLQPLLQLFLFGMQGQLSLELHAIGCGRLSGMAMIRTIAVAHHVTVLYHVTPNQTIAQKSSFGRIHQDVRKS